MRTLPVIDITPLRKGGAAGPVIEALGQACRELGFFYVTGHGVDHDLEMRLEELSHQFFAQSEAQKMDIAMAKAGRAWRGYFPLGGELTSGQPDWKEGLYFGSEHPAEHPRVLSQTPLFGRNLYPEVEGFRTTILLYCAAMKDLGDRLLGALALSLGLRESYFAERFTSDPTLLFRIFHYPPPPADRSALWGVGEHTDYGLLTILKQDTVGGLEVKSQGQWIEAPPIPGSFVCNIGDMLDRLTGGLYRSTPHRVKNRSQKERYSFPFFYDPSWDAPLEALPIPTPKARSAEEEQRWDAARLHEIGGTYGDYLLKKVGKVFPDLKAQI